MLKNTNNHELAELGIDEKFFLFYQIWKELTDGRTVDSYRYRIMNTLSGLRELNDVIQLRLNGAHSTNHNVDECRVECAEIIAEDPVVKVHHYSIRCSLLRHLNKKATTNSELNALRYQIDYAYERLSENYSSRLLDELEAGINSFDEKRIAQCARICVSNFVSDGWSTPALKSLVDMLHGSLGDPSKWDSFRSTLLDSKSCRYRVYIPLKLQYRHSSKLNREAVSGIVRDAINEMGFEIATKEEALQADQCLAKHQLPAKHDFIALNVQAHDAYSACYKTIDSCSNALNMLAFYNYIEPWDIMDVSCWVVDRDNGVTANLRRANLYTDFDSVLNNKRVFQASKSFMTMGESALTTKLKAAYAYASMGKASGSQSQKFMNTWIALESLCRGDAFDSIIANVLGTVPHALCTRYIYKLFRNFVEDCGRCGLDLTFSSCNYSFSNNTPNEERVRNVISIMKNDDLRNQLEGKCAVNSLLLYRCRELVELALQPQLMFERIKLHHQTVRRQLSRLYRIRNDIAHAGYTSVDSLELYTSHLVNYLTAFVMEFVTRADSMRGKQAEVVFETIKDNYNVFLDMTAKKVETENLGQLIGLTSSGIINFI